MAIMDYKPMMKHEGRWYRIFIESDGTAPVITESDISDCVISDGTLRFPDEFHPIEILTDIHLLTDVSTTPKATGTINISTTSHVYTNIPLKDAFDWVYLYVFGYFTHD